MGAWIFRWRGAIMAALALLVLVCARPTAESWWCGITIAFVGELWRLYALGYSGEHTRSNAVKAPLLITSGPFKRCRNPLYLGNIANALGVTCAAVGAWPWPQQLALLVWCLTSLTVVYGQCIAVEEAFLREKFGEQYRRYYEATPRLWPKWGQLSGADTEHFSWANLRYERSTLTWWLLIWGYLAWLTQVYCH